MDAEAQDIVIKQKIAIEICLSSNILCQTVDSLDVHHILSYLKEEHPIAICVRSFRLNYGRRLT